MTIQVCRMKYSDEQVIADIGEVYANDEAKENGERPICMSFKNPYSLHIVNESEQGYNITFKKWNPYSVRLVVGLNLKAKMFLYILFGLLL